MLPRISVIVPIYNAEKYLRRCINSILVQEFNDFELILVDDGSKDSSKCICEEFAQKDSRVRVLHQKNRGVSTARNLGIDNAVGEWIVFIDSDDWVETNYFSALIVGEIGDLCVCNCKVEGADYICSQVVEDGFHDKVFLSNAMYSGAFFRGVYLGPWCKLFRKSIVDRFKIRFDANVSSGEDSLFVLKYFCHVDSYFGTSLTEYHYWQPGNGLSGQQNLANNFINLAKEARILSNAVSVKFNLDREKFFVDFISGGFYAYLRCVVMRTDMTEEQVNELFTVFPYDCYVRFTSRLGRLLKLSKIFYKNKLFNVFVLYLKILEKTSYQFFAETL